MPFTILLVEDDEKITEIIQDYFLTKGEKTLTLTCAADGDAGMEYLYEKEFDLVLLDVMLPGMDGFGLCREIRKHADTPIIFITARGAEEDRLYGYQLGCDDYVVKPFSVGELYAKVQALLRRSKGMVRKEVQKVGDIALYPMEYRVTVQEKEINLAPKEYALLKYLIEHKNQVVTRDELLVRIWGYDYEGNDRVVDNHMKKLRKALMSSGTLIKTIVTKGYRMEDIGEK